MRKIPMKWIPAYAALALIGAGSGWLQGASVQSFRFPSSQRKQEEPRLSYDDMPCPSNDEYRRLASIVKLELPAGLDACTDPLHNKIARLLAYAEKLKITMAPDWAPSLQADLGHPLTFLGSMSNKMGIDLTQETTIAYNKTNEKAIFLGGLFFEEDPLEALAVLVHEARHSSSNDPGHVTCRRGDIPRALGGCDQRLSVETKDAGAYSYGAAFYAALGLYAEGIPSSDREYMLALSLATISTRFNELPEELAQAFDLISVLDEDGSVYLLHPFTREPIPLGLGFLAPGERVKRLDFNVKNNGLLLFTTKNRLFTWEPGAGAKRLFPEQIPDSLPILDAARMRVLFEDYPHYNFLSSENQLFFHRFSPEKREYELAPYPIFRREDPRPELSGIFMGLSGRSIFLGKDGQIYVGPQWGDEPTFDPRRDLQVSGRKWKYGTGGVVFESLYGITDDGRVHYTRIEFLPADPDSFFDKEVYTIQESSLQPTGGRSARKIFEGLSLRALLDTDGDLQIETYGREQRSFWRKLPGRIVDFTVMRRHLAGRSIIPTPARTNFASACGIQKPVPDPWLGVGLGLNANGELVIGLPSGPNPCLLTGSKRYKELKFRAWRGSRSPRQRDEAVALPGVEPPQHTRTVLWATELNGQVTPLLPYSY